MFPDSKVATKYRTKTSHMLNGSVANHLADGIKEELSLTQWYGLATDESSDKDDKFLPVLVRHVGKVSGLTEDFIT